VSYVVNGVTTLETWSVPSSATPVGLPQVRLNQPPAPAYTFPISQVLPPVPCALPNNFLSYTTQWVCNQAGAVKSVFARTGDVVAQANDYNFSQLAGAASDGQIASSYSGVGACTNQFVQTLTRNSTPGCATVTSAFTDSSIYNTSNPPAANVISSPTANWTWDIGTNGYGLVFQNTSGSSWTPIYLKNFGNSSGTTVNLLLGNEQTAYYAGLVYYGANTTYPQALNIVSTGGSIFLSSYTGIVAKIDTSGNFNVGAGGGSQFQVNSSGILKRYANVATAGNGIAAITYASDLAAQTAAVTDTVMGSPVAVGLFLFHGQINCALVGSGASAALNLKWTDTSSTAQTSSVTATCSSLGSGSIASLNTTIRAKASTNITWGVTIVGTPNYDVDVRLAQL
jgi:hypothetical protein